MYLKFHVSANAKPCMCCKLGFEYMYLYDPEEPLNVCLEGGEVCIDFCTIFGYVSAWYCDYDCGEIMFPIGVPGARVHLSKCEEAIGTTYSDGSGHFTFECLEPLNNLQLGGDCGYCVDISHCVIPDCLITAFDAALILKYLVCLDPLSCCYWYKCGQDFFPQQIAADVNCTGVITAYDASLILQFVVGILPLFPCPDMIYWTSLGCDWCVYDCGFNMPDLAGDPGGGPLGRRRVPARA
jgi:hypothetical protein